jgi:hypothetical protein
MQDLKRSDSSDRTREATEIFRLARRIGVSAGLERSFKIAAGSVDARRFLISLAPRPDFRIALDEGLTALSFPDSLRRALEESLKQTRFLHLGYEEPRGTPVCKLYCEAAPADGARVKMHTGFKWRPGEPGEFASDEYWRLDGLDEAKLRAHMAHTLEPNPGLLGTAQTLVDRILTRIPVSELFFLEVMRGGIRRSIDLRLYDAGLGLRDMSDVSETVANLFGAGRVDRIIAAHGNESLGHVSMGPTFMTFYHGAEDL